MDRENLRKDYIQLIASAREYVEQQLQLGFTELESEPEQEQKTWQVGIRP